MQGYWHWMCLCATPQSLKSMRLGHWCAAVACDVLPRPVRGKAGAGHGPDLYLSHAESRRDVASKQRGGFQQRTVVFYAVSA